MPSDSKQIVLRWKTLATILCQISSSELVVCALLHDIGELYTPSNHGDFAAALLRPYISRKAQWVL